MSCRFLCGELASTFLSLYTLEMDYQTEVAAISSEVMLSDVICVLTGVLPRETSVQHTKVQLMVLIFEMPIIFSPSSP